MRIRSLVLAGATYAMTYAIFAISLHAQTPDVATDKVVLTISAAPGEDDLNFTLADLKSLPATEFSTQTIWTADPQTFTGVSLVDLLDAADMEVQGLRATALNGYDVQIPASDVVAGGPIVAYAIDGEPMPVRDRGPLWIIYPFDSKPEYQTETTYSRSIWQLYRLEAVD